MKTFACKKRIGSYKYKLVKEIERKYLVDIEKWEKLEKPQPVYIKQGYISKSEKGVVRLRIKGENAYLTIKSQNYGIERLEFEYMIPLEDASAMFHNFCEKWIEKKRYEILHEGKVWEVDEFILPVQDFILAEVELFEKEEVVTTPDWVGREVSEEPLYFNSNLI